MTPIEAQADLHHQWFLGLQLMVSTRHGPDVVYDWIFRLFRRQHEEKFLSSFEKLGLIGQPHAVACAKYHVLSNGIGGVPVEYYEESLTKAWVRFRYPRWMFDGPVICGMPVEASRGFLNGWYAHNGVSLGNPRLGFVCASEDIGGWGLCGYFKEFDHDLAPGERLQFAPDERPPPFDPAAQPAPPTADWPHERLAKAKRNYAVDYIRNGLSTLIDTIGQDAAMELAKNSARLTGLQRARHMCDMLGLPANGSTDCGSADSSPADAATLLATLFQGMGDEIQVTQAGTQATILHINLRLSRGLTPEHGENLIACWVELWRGVVDAGRVFLDVQAKRTEDGLAWTISPKA